MKVLIIYLNSIKSKPDDGFKQAETRSYVLLNCSINKAVLD